MSDIVQKLWGFCHTLRHDGIDYGDYIEQITYLLFLKMADERGDKLLKRDIKLPDGCDWQSLKLQSGSPLLENYTKAISKLSKGGGILSDIFFEAQSRFTSPVNLKKLISEIDNLQWTELDVHVKADAFEGLLERAANEGKKGAGQYFTPRELIRSIVRCVKPDPREHKDFTVSDPACGVGGFLVEAYEWLMNATNDGALKRDVAQRVYNSVYYGQELVQRPRRLALMNLFLHGITPDIKLGDTIYDTFGGRLYDVVLSNPPFGTKGANATPERDDFTIKTSSKQLNFVQHIINILKKGGRAAVVLPDNCLFENKAGEVFEILMEDCNLHTILRLPRGTFSPYSQGVKANVIFFQKGLSTKETWIYDARSNVQGVTKKERRLSMEHFADFEKCYGSDPRGRSPRIDTGLEGRFRKFNINEIKERNYKLDITWLKDDSVENGDELPEPQVLAEEAIAELEAVIEDLKKIVAAL